MLLSATDVTQSQRFINTTFTRDALVINLSLDPDSITANELTRFEESSNSAIRGIEVMALALSQVIHAWDVEDSEPTPEYLLTLPIGLLTDLNEFCFSEIFPDKDDLMNLRRWLRNGGIMGHCPDYFWDHQDAHLLNVSVMEINDVPMRVRLEARVVDTAKKQARASIANKHKAMLVHSLEM